MKQNKWFLLLRQNGLRRGVLTMCVLLAMGMGAALHAQSRITKQMLIGEWQFERVVLEEQAGQYSKPSRVVFTELDSLRKNMAYPFFYTVSSLVVMPDVMNLNTLVLSLLDAPFDVKMLSGRQVLEVEDNRPEDQREQATMVYNITLGGKLMILSGKYFYRNANGQSVEGVLTTTLHQL